MSESAARTGFAAVAPVVTDVAVSMTAAPPQTAANGLAAVAGAALLDECRPGWFRDVELPRLDVASPCDCPLGQLYGKDGQTGLIPFLNGLRTIGIRYASEDVARLGFSVGKGFRGLEERAERYTGLTSAWRAEILKRRSTDAENETEG